MALNTYNDLISAVGNWLERSDLTSRVPDFIALAEAQTNRLLRVRQMEARATAVLDAGEEYFAFPLDFIAEKSVSISDGTCSWDLDPQPFEVLETATPATGTPTHYAIVGDSFHVHPTPDRMFTTRLVYYSKIPPLGPDQQTNWLLREAPDAYLYGALTHAAPYLEDDTGTSNTFAALYSAAISGIKAAQRTRVGKLTLDQVTEGRSFNIIKGS